MDYLLPSSAIVAGFILLIWGANRFVYGASATAANLGVSPLIIGLTIIGFGTSAPEILVSVNAALAGAPEMAVGNAIGSNIANVGLVLGVTALILPLTVKSKTLRKEFSIMFLIMILSLILVLDYELSRNDGIILLFALLLLMYWIIKTGMTSKDRTLEKETEKEIPHISLTPALLWTLTGMIVLIVSSDILVDGATTIATLMGVDKFIIGITIVAIGTSLPELAVSISSVLKKEPDLAIGNIIGSNMFNILAVLSLPAIIAPIELKDYVLYRDMPYMIGLSIALFVFAYGWKKKTGQINRIEGSILLATYISFMVVLYITGKA